MKFININEIKHDRIIVGADDVVKIEELMPEKLKPFFVRYFKPIIYLVGFLVSVAGVSIPVAVSIVALIIEVKRGFIVNKEKELNS